MSSQPSRPPPGAARQAATDAVDRSGRTPASMDLRQAADGFGRCVRSRFEVRLRVPTIGLPWRSDRPAIAVRAGHQEVVDPYRDGLAGPANCRAGS